MKRLTLVAVALLIAAPTLAAGSTRTLSHTQDAAGVETVAIDTGIGEVTVIGTDHDTIEVEVELKAKRGGIFFSSRRAERDIEKLELTVEMHGSKLSLSVDGLSHEDHDYSEDWSVRLPAKLGFALDAGVGDVRIEGVAGPITVDAGVGDIRIFDSAADVYIDAGVGDIVIEGDWRAFGRVSASCGVGDATLRTPEGHESGRGFIGKDVGAKGPGSATLEVDAGVGDVTIRLR